MDKNKVSESIKDSIDRVIRIYSWKIDESTFQVLNEKRCLWVARVTTTHRTKHGEPESSFYILVRECFTPFFIDNGELVDLALWASKQD